MAKDRTITGFSRPPSERERVQLERRARRLEVMRESVEQATRNLERLPSRVLLHVRVRPDFVYRRDLAAGDPSGRRLPSRADRPPAARLISPLGAALRLFLTALFEAQVRCRAGAHPANKWPLVATGSDLGWIDLLASDAQPAGSGKTYMGVSDKKGRQLKHALRRLEEEGLVTFPRAAAAGNKYERFVLLHEGGRRTAGPNPPYQVPRPSESFPLPVTLFTNGWIHVMEDTELVFVLMLAAEQHAMNAADVTVSGRTRLLHYGIGRDAFEAHRLLNGMGIVTVKADPSRRPDGKVERYNKGEGARPHVFRFLTDGFERNGLVVLRQYLEHQLGR